MEEANTDIESNKDDVRIEVDDGSIKCNKQYLIKNSKYFEAMFQGDFKESKGDAVKIEGVDVSSLKTVIAMSEDDSCYVSMEDILLILYTASILEFGVVLSRLVEICIENLAIHNCLKIWFEAERQNLSPLYLKAKCMALSNFVTIKDTEEFLELNIDQLKSYIGSRYLETPSEIEVFEALMKWWIGNKRYFASENLCDIIFKVLSNLDVNSLSLPDLEYVISHKEIEDIPDCRLTFMNIKNVRLKNDLLTATDYHNEHTRKLCRSKKRISFKYLCFIADRHENELSPKKLKIDESNRSSDDKRIVYWDKYNGKRYLTKLESSNKEDYIALVYYDTKHELFKKLIPVNNMDLDQIQGFRILSSHHNIFLFGGEYSLGKGSWNTTLRMYDSIRDHWSIIEKLPQVRRHFQSCIIGHILFVVGGTTNFRIIAEDLFYYNFDTNRWSKLIPLPTNCKKGKCCEFLNKLVIVQIHNKKAVHFFNLENQSWEERDILDPQKAIPELIDYQVFSNRGKLYIKGDDLLIELEQKYTNILVTNLFKMSRVHDQMLQSNVCSDVVYTISQDLLDIGYGYSLHRFNLETGEESYLFENITEKHLINVDGVKYKIRMDVKSFTFKHHETAVGDHSINDCYL